MKFNESDPLGQRLKTITTDLKLYIEKRAELLFLNVGEHISRIVAESVQKVAGILLIFGASIFLMVALALYLGELLNSDSLGYVITAVPLLVAGILFLYLKPESILEWIQDQFDKEVIRALSLNGEEQRESLKLKEPETEEEIKS